MSRKQVCPSFEFIEKAIGRTLIVLRDVQPDLNQVLLGQRRTNDAQRVLYPPTRR
jgi:hypothetical protein